MNKITATIFIIIFTTISMTQIQELDSNLFSLINEQLQDTVNKVFRLLKLNKNFKTQYQIQVLIFIQNNLNSVAEDHYRMFKDVANQSKDGVRLLNNTLFKLDKPLQELSNEIFGSKFKKKLPKAKNDGELVSVLLIKDTLNFFKEYAFTEYFNIEGADVDVDTTFEKVKDIYKTRVMQNRSTIDNPRTWKSSDSRDARKMYKGKHTSTRRFPFMASVHILDEFTCAASIISKNHVITAATCLQVVFNNPQFIQEFPKSIAIRVGSNFATRQGEIYLGTQVAFHPLYNPLNLDSNLCIITIEKSLRFRKKNRLLRRIEYRRNPKPLTDIVKKIVLIGWGNEGNLEEDEFQQMTYAHVDIYNITECVEVYTSKFVNDKHICVGYSKKGSGACPKDVGGPGIINSILIGVVSFGPPICGTPDAPTVFTDLLNYLDWIDSFVKTQQPVTGQPKTGQPTQQVQILTTETQTEQPTVPPGLNVINHNNRFRTTSNVIVTNATTATTPTLQVTRGMLREQSASAQPLIVLSKETIMSIPLQEKAFVKQLLDMFVNDNKMESEPKKKYSKVIKVLSHLLNEIMQKELHNKDGKDSVVLEYNSDLEIDKEKLKDSLIRSGTRSLENQIKSLLEITTEPTMTTTQEIFTITHKVEKPETTRKAEEEILEKTTETDPPIRFTKALQDESQENIDKRNGENIDTNLDENFAKVSTVETTTNLPPIRPPQMSTTVATTEVVTTTSNAPSIVVTTTVPPTTSEYNMQVIERFPRLNLNTSDMIEKIFKNGFRMKAKNSKGVFPINPKKHNNDEFIFLLLPKGTNSSSKVKPISFMTKKKVMKPHRARKERQFQVPSEQYSLEDTERSTIFPHRAYRNKHRKKENRPRLRQITQIPNRYIEETERGKNNRFKINNRHDLYQNYVPSAFRVGETNMDVQTIYFRTQLNDSAHVNDTILNGDDNPTKNKITKISEEDSYFRSQPNDSTELNDTKLYDKSAREQKSTKTVEQDSHFRMVNNTKELNDTKQDNSAREQKSTKIDKQHSHLRMLNDSKELNYTKLKDNSAREQKSTKIDEQDSHFRMVNDTKELNDTKLDDYNLTKITSKPRDDLVFNLDNKDNLNVSWLGGSVETNETLVVRRSETLKQSDGSEEEHSILDYMYLT